MKNVIKVITLWAFMATAANAAMVQGDYLGTFSGNDSEAALLAAIGVEVVLLAKVDAPDTSSDGLELTNLVFDEDDEPVSGDWSYSGEGLVDYLVVKAGNAFAVYRYTDANTDNMRNMGIWDTTDLAGKGMSHVAAYQAVIPVPGALWLFAGGLVFLARRRRSA